MNSEQWGRIAADRVLDEIMQRKNDECDTLRRMVAGWILYGVGATAVIVYLLAVQA